MCLRSLIISIFIVSVFILPCSAFIKERPVVGILSQPISLHNETHQYIAASYVKWLESAGALSIPIPYDADESLVKEIFSQINGILFPGGSADLPQSAKWIWNLALESNQRGEYFPVWGTCLGFEILISLTGGENALQSGFSAENVSLPLIFPSESDVMHTNGVFSIASQLYPSTTERDILSTHSITMNNHFNGITPEHFLNNTELTSSFHVTSTNVDLDGKPFVSTIESILYPIYGVQYHPEKNNFEYGTWPGSTMPYEAISHSEEAVALSMRLATFFVSRVRRSSIGDYNLRDTHPMIIDYPVVRSIMFEQIYIIPPAEHWEEGGKHATETMHLRGSTSID